MAKDKKLPKIPRFSTYYRIKGTRSVAEWVSATSHVGTFELKFPNGDVLEFGRHEIEPITPEEYMAAQNQISH